MDSVKELDYNERRRCIILPYAMHSFSLLQTCYIARKQGKINLYVKNKYQP